MGGTRYNGRQRGRSSRFEVIALLLGLALIVSQAIGVVTAAADGKGPSGLTSIGSGSTKTGGDSTSTSGTSSKSDGSSKSTGTAKTGTSGATVQKTSGDAAALASTYDGLSFRLQGCKGSAGLLPNAQDEFICADNLYTDGNLGKGWNELDLVPHRIIIDAGNSAPATQTYKFDIAADNLDGGKVGYDFIENGFESTSSACKNVSIGPQQTVGSNPQQIYREITVTQDKNTTCQLDLYIRLGLGAHLYPGSSLHSNLLNDSETTANIGNKENSIPVNEIQPQEISKDMSASQGTDFVWDVTKSPSPASVDFGNTCAVENSDPSANVDITVSWTKQTTAGGDVSITTHIYATNPAHRVITVNVTDKVYKGTGQAAGDLVHTGTSGNVDVAGNTSDFLILEETFTVPSGPTTFNDVATATYTDKETGFNVPGTTTATATADVQSDGPSTNGTVTINDVESITGTELSFSVDSTTGASGSFDGGYTEGDVAQPGDEVSWTSDPQTTDGSVTFHKTIYFDGPGATSGSLDDTATVVGDGEAVLDSANASVDITADATLSLTIDKSVPAGSVSGSQDFVFDVTGPSGFSKTVTLTFDGSSNTESTTFSVPEEGTYTVTEQTADGWQPQSPKSVVISLADCTGTATFANVPVEKGSITIVKDAQPDDPQDFGFTGDLGSFSLDDDSDGTLSDTFTSGALDAGTYAVTEAATTGWTLAGISCDTGEGQSISTRDGSTITINLAQGEDVTCTFTNTKNATPPPPPPPAPLGIQIIKSGPALAHVGDTIKYTFDVSLTTSTPLTNITVSDPKCSAAPTLDSKSGGDQDATLEPGETWHYSCTHVVTASDSDPLPNTATASGTDSQGRNTSDTDDHLVDIIHPAIKIVKTANPLSIAPGETVTYTYKVTNIGDVTLYNVSVDDDKLGHICDIAQLDVDETQTCTKDFTAREDNLGPLKNVAVAAGEDETGYPVRDDDKASIDVVLGTTVTPTTTPPSGTAFTGSTVLPLGAIALVLLIVGTGLIYMGRRREDGSQA
jgi:hypothetical protein